jgi:glycerophosphoryl diester phosphodiesterase
MKVSKRTTIIVLALTALFFAFTLFHASWLADAPKGSPKLVAAAAVAPALGTDGCTATANSGYGAIAVGPDISALQLAAGSEADAVVITTEMVGGAAVIARQYQSTCAADTAKPRGTLSEALTVLSKPELFWEMNEDSDAKLLSGAIPDNGRNIFFGTARTLSPTRAIRKNPPPLDVRAARRCASEYRASGITGSIPRSCADGWVILTLDDLGFTLWGWPNRFLDRMAKANIRVIVAQDVEGTKIKGLTEARQYGEIASSYNGYVWIDKIEELGPALRR